MTQKRPESRATLVLGRSYTQHAPTTQHEVAAVYPIPPCFEVGQRFQDASSPGLPWALFSIFFVAHTRRDSNLRRPPSTWEISPEVPCSELRAVHGARVCTEAYRNDTSKTTSAKPRLSGRPTNRAIRAQESSPLKPALTRPAHVPVHTDISLG